ncbi:FAD-binding protein [Aquihabitans sp. G128]|nr:FAD-binding protein [Aquihabitans sp. G128]
MTSRGRTLASTVLVIGAGGSGLRTAIEVAERGVDVLVLGKRPREDAHTSLAAGGINAALGTMDPDDSWQQHAADTIKEGCLLSDRPRVPAAPCTCRGSAAKPGAPVQSPRGQTSTTPWATAQGVCATSSTASSKVGASMMAKPAMGRSDTMYAPSVSVIPAASWLRTWTGVRAMAIVAPAARRRSSCAWAASRTAWSVRS